MQASVTEPQPPRASDADSPGAGHVSGLAVGPVLFVLVLLLLATVFDGAFDIRQWGPPTVFGLVTLAALMAAGGGAPVRGWAPAVAIAAIWGFAAWSALSATWAPSPADALDGAGRTVLYAAIVTLPLVAVRDLSSLRIAAAGVVVGIALLAVGTLVALFADGESLYLAGRLDSPVGYRNATALLFAMGFWPLLCLAVHRDGGRVLRGAALAAGVLELGLAYLTQSRGVFLGLGVGGIVALALGPDRVRRAWMAIIAFAIIAAASGKLITPYHAFDGGQGAASSHDIAVATHALAIAAVGAFVVGALLATFDKGLRAHSSPERPLRATARIALAAVVIVGIVGGLVAVGNPIDQLHDKYDEFRSDQTTASESSRLTSTGGQRHDAWRVALDKEFVKHPIVGVGQDGYARDFYASRHTDRNFDDPHGLGFQVLAELGLVGAALLLAFLVAIGVTIGSGVRGLGRGDRALVAGTAATGAVLLGQSLVDWMWRIPGVAALGLFALAVAAAMVLRSREPGVRTRPVMLPLRAAVATPLVLAALGVASLYLADHYVRRGEHTGDPARRLAAGRNVLRFDPWALQGHYLQASAHESDGDRAGARAQLLDALRREPHNFTTLALLGDVDARAGDFDGARGWYGRALALNPLDVGLRQLAQTGGRQPQAR